MRRLARRLFTLCSAVSLLLCVAVCVLWARGYWVQDGFSVTAYPQAGWYRQCRVLSSTDRVTVVAEECLTLGAAMREEHPPGLAFFSQAPYAPGGARGLLGFYLLQWSRPTSTGNERQLRIEVPFWFLAILSIALPARQLFSYLRRPDQRGNRCHRCGYDLRATPGRCPESGAAAVAGG